MKVPRVRFTVRGLIFGVALTAALLAIVAQGIAWQRRRVANLYDWSANELLDLAEKTEDDTGDVLSDPKRAALAEKQAGKLRKSAEEFHIQAERIRRSADHPFSPEPPNPLVPK